MVGNRWLGACQNARWCRPIHPSWCVVFCYFWVRFNQMDFKSGHGCHPQKSCTFFSRWRRWQKRWFSFTLRIGHALINCTLWRVENFQTTFRRMVLLLHWILTFEELEYFLAHIAIWIVAATWRQFSSQLLLHHVLIRWCCGRRFPCQLKSSWGSGGIVLRSSSGVIGGWKLWMALSDGRSRVAQTCHRCRSTQDTWFLRQIWYWILSGLS